MLKVESNRELCWMGSRWLPGLFDGKHCLTILPVETGRVRFVQHEVFSGILVPLFSRSLDVDTRRGFEEMNQALKAQAEA